MKDCQRLLDILAAIKAIERYAVVSFEQFQTDYKTQDAILYNPIIIGEATNRISEESKRNITRFPGLQ